MDMLLAALTDPFGHGHMGETAENVAQRFGITRADQDEFAADSHARAAQAIALGRFDEQIVPIPLRKGGAFAQDEHVRRETTPATLAQLKPAFRSEGTVTAGNASGINDGAAALVLATEKATQRLRAEPLARLVTSAVAGVDPSMMGLGPVPAVRRVLERARVSIDEIDVIESNEAFAAQALAVSRELGLPPERTNPNGGAIALGHPVGASGAIVTVKALHELRRVRGRYALVTLCIGGGQGIAALFASP
jgi:acetyl-CoA C-acetyltransferase